MKLITVDIPVKEVNYHYEEYDEDCCISLIASEEKLKVVWLKSLKDFHLKNYDKKENIVVRFKDCNHVFTFGDIDAYVKSSGQADPFCLEKDTPGWAIKFGEIKVIDELNTKFHYTNMLMDFKGPGYDMVIGDGVRILRQAPFNVMRSESKLDDHHRNLYRILRTIEYNTYGPKPTDGFIFGLGFREFSIDVYFHNKKIVFSINDDGFHSKSYKESEYVEEGEKEYDNNPNYIPLRISSRLVATL